MQGGQDELNHTLASWPHFPGPRPGTDAPVASSTRIHEHTCPALPSFLDPTVTSRRQVANIQSLAHEFLSRIGPPLFISIINARRHQAESATNHLLLPPSTSQLRTFIAVTAVVALLFNQPSETSRLPSLIEARSFKYQHPLPSSRISHKPSASTQLQLLTLEHTLPSQSPSTSSRQPASFLRFSSSHRSSPLVAECWMALLLLGSPTSTC
ncbi:hypothetical protein LZ32DRAFT_59928 [Colletotrichum eremochloae]|nr:hypothetical protein LZ32DRAFT_59928 [Colletotrichum eremochloae]